MRRFIRSEAGATLIWVAMTLLLAAAVSPWIYQAGKSLAAAAAVEDLGSFLEWLGAAAGRSKFPRYFSRSLVLSALFLLPLLWYRIRQLRRLAGQPEGVERRHVGWYLGVRQLAAGCMLTGGLLWVLACVLQMVGIYGPATDAPAGLTALNKILVPMVAAPLVEEPLFRGLLLGLWMRSARTSWACVGSSLLFAFLHFLEPPAGVAVQHPESALAGFQLLGGILHHFSEPLFFLTDFATLFVVGMILAWARVRTGSLWFSIGLHAGWVAAFKWCNLMLETMESHPLLPWGVGSNLRSGALPMAVLALTAVGCQILMERWEAEKKRSIRA